MDRNYYLIVALRNFEGFHVLSWWWCGIWCYHYTSVRVVSARSTDCFDERLCILIYDLSWLSVAYPLVALASKSRLVHALENEVFVIALKSVAYLLPEGFELLYILIGTVFLRHIPLLVVGVEDNEHSVVDTVIDNFLNSVHPCFVNCIVLVHVSTPWNRKSEHVEACVLDLVYHQFCGFHISPWGFSVNAWAACGIHGIAKTPAHFHLSHKVFCSGHCHRVIGMLLSIFCSWGIFLSLWGVVRTATGCHHWYAHCKGKHCCK